MSDKIEKLQKYEVCGYCECGNPDIFDEYGNRVGLSLSPGYYTSHSAAVARERVLVEALNGVLRDAPSNLTIHTIKPEEGLGHRKIVLVFTDKQIVELRELIAEIERMA